MLDCSNELETNLPEGWKNNFDFESIDETYQKVGTWYIFRILLYFFSQTVNLPPHNKEHETNLHVQINCK